MDIIVTIPKSEAANQVREDAFVQANDNVVQFWAIRRKPKDLLVGDRVFFSEHGFVTCYHKFLGFANDPVCEITGRVWYGLNLVLACPPTYVDNPIPMPAFRGFRYVRDPIKFLGKEPAICV